MNLVPWKNKTANGGLLDSDTGITRFREELDDLFSRVFGCRVLGWNWPPGATAFGPNLDLAESDKEITVAAELPGIDPKDIEISVTGNVLIIRGEKKQQLEQKTGQYQYSERQYGTFHRSMQLPSAADPENVKASYKDGVLTIVLAKHPQGQPRRVPIKTS